MKRNDVVERYKFKPVEEQKQYKTLNEQNQYFFNNQHALNENRLDELQPEGGILNEQGLGSYLLFKSEEKGWRC